jgi:transposase
MASYEMERRPTGRGLLNRGISEPTRDEIYDMVHVEHLSYKNIAAIYDVDLSAIQHWLDKHDIPRPKSRITFYKGEPRLPSHDELLELYEQGKSIVGIGRMFNVSDGPIRRLFREHGIAIKKEGWDSGKRISCKDGHLVRSTYEQKVDDWLYENGIDHIYEPVLPYDHRCHADFTANGWYIEIWGVLSNPVYKKRKQRKLALYQANNMPLIELYPHHFVTARNDKWKRILMTCLTAKADFQGLPFFA